MQPTTLTPEPATAPTPRHQVRQTIAVGICGGVVGASILEALASIWLHPASIIAQPTVSPLVVAGAILGAAVALTVLRRRDGPRANGFPTGPSRATALFVDSMPLSPMAWEPGPRYIPYLDEGEPTAYLSASLPIDTLDVCPAPRAPRHSASHVPARTHALRRLPGRS